MMMRRLLLLSALAAWSACQGCQGCGVGQQPSVEIEAPLVGETPVAEKEWDGILVEFGSPSALPLLGEGWSFGETAPDGNAFRWAVGDAASFRFQSASAGRRLAWIECQPHRFPGAPEQALGITLNGNELPPLHLREGRSRYPVELSLVEGENVMEIRFRYARAPRDAGGDRASPCSDTQSASRRTSPKRRAFEPAPSTTIDSGSRSGSFTTVARQ